MLRDEHIDILLVEDSPTAAQFVTANLEASLAVAWSMEHAATLAAALELLDKHYFDLALVDLYLPDSQGLDTFSSVHAAAPDMPIVIVSGDENEELALSAMRQGAQDFVVKGHGYTVTLSRSARFALERRRRLEMERELRLAERVQQRMFPHLGPQLAGFDIGGLTIPAAQTSGDMYDFIVPLPAISDDSVGVAVGDVSGHGLGPALVMVEVRMCLQALCMTEPDIAQVLNLTNQLLVREGCEHFVSMFFGYIDADARTVHYASAGHQGLVVTAGGTCGRCTAPAWCSAWTPTPASSRPRRWSCSRATWWS
jgi:DNA-binding NarL/FixJ family response regulator